MRPVYRIAWILDRVKGKNVLDLGAYDETALIKLGTDYWLHGKLAETAKTVIGVDNSSKLPPEGLKTSAKSVIIRGDIFNLSSVASCYEIDTIIAGELIEHLPNTLDFLKSIKNEKSFSGKEMLLTTPNATSLHNVLLSLLSKESTHCDHLQIYSYKTLNTLCAKAGFSEWEIIPYHVAFPEMILQSKGIIRFAAIVCEKIINFFEKLFPLLSGGWVVRIKI